MRIVDREKIAKLRAEGMSLHAIADKLGIGYGTVRKRLALVKSAEEIRKQSDSFLRIP
jgi:DNA invertase Pin-like site-specific DNA recombinase